MEAMSIVERTDRSGPPRAKYLPSGAMRALSVKHVKTTHVYSNAEITMLGSISQTASINGPVDNPTKTRPQVNTRVFQGFY